MLWDLFCRVIDNHGDIGVCWRLAADLAHRGEQVRLWVDDGSALAWMAPQGHPVVQVRGWADAAVQPPMPGDVVVEAFGCELPPAFVQAMARQADTGQQPAWINLEYLTAEPFAERNHGLPSPVLSGPGLELAKRFFYPGFTERTGGLLREPDLLARQAAFDRGAWLARHGVVAGELAVSLFCYEPPALAALLKRWAAGPRPISVLVTAGRARAAAEAAAGLLDHRQPGWNAAQRLRLAWLPLLTQFDFDHLLWACDLNFVRGEDSLVRALWAGKPLVWQLYPQDDGAHHAKLAAFLGWLQPPPALRELHEAWNGSTAPQALAVDIDGEWIITARQARERLLAQPDLATQLLRHARQHHLTAER